jgi:CDP-2,3-bis-(O-geranylgeranyl)-sn-glycerol synthase
MRIELIFLLVMIIVANGAPILQRWGSKSRNNYPIDFGWRFFDGHPLFGSSKTWPGLAVAFVFTSLFSELFGFGILFGLQIAALAMAGDLCSSFIKRRLNLRVSSRAIILDQLPESLLPTLGAYERLGLNVLELLLILVLFILFELLLSRVFYIWGIRKHPY